MKKSAIILFAVIGSIFSMNSCTSFLDVDKYFYDMLSIDSAFSKRVYVDGWLSNTYDYLKQTDLSEMNFPTNWGTDDLININGKKIQNGNYSASDLATPGNHLVRAYECIRKASVFMDNVNKCRELTLREIEDMKGQARFLRAFAYWSLVRTYGAVPIIPEAGLDVSLSYEELSLPRAHFDEVINFIDRDLSAAALALPPSRTINNMGRPTIGAALALRARVLLYAASPMNNGNTDFFNIKNRDKTTLYNQQHDESKWARAAAAAADVINLSTYELNIVEPKTDIPEHERPPYDAQYSEQLFPDGWKNVDPYASYKEMFDGSIRGSKNKELIFTRTITTGDQGLENFFNRPSMPKTSKGGNKIGVSQKMIDAYYMNNGQTIEDAATSGYYVRDGFTTANYDPTNMNGAPYMKSNVSLMYSKREPRFYASIAFNGAVWECESSAISSEKNFQCWYYKDEANGKQGFTEDCPLSGVGIKKYYNREDSYSDGGYRTNKTEPTIRYAEVLLIYAEALNEITDGVTHSMLTYTGERVEITRDVNKMRESFRPIRMRVGLPDLDQNDYDVQLNFRKKLKKERQIELFAENFRFYDLRRWKDAMEEENQLLMGCNINVTSDNTSRQTFYDPTVIISLPKIFIEKMYLFPFPIAELKRNVNLTQNPGW